MIPARQQRVVLAQVPTGVPLASDFRLEEAPVPHPAPGQFLARTLYLSLDPYLRSAIVGRHIGHAATPIGAVVPGRSVARVVESQHDGFAAGDLVVMETGWQEFALGDGAHTRRVTSPHVTSSTALGVLGMPGLTAWAGTTCLAQAAAGEVFVVSAAAGAVGSAAGQMARIAGCRVVGIAGSTEKCALVTGTFGFDACIDYTRDGWREALAEATGGRIDVYFDNAGGAVLEVAMNLLALRGRVVLCGLPGQYNTGVPLTIALASIIKKRAHVMGLVVYDFDDRFEEYLAAAESWVADGRLRFHEDRAHGLAAAPAAFNRLMSGKNVGKSLVVVGEEAES